MEIDPLVSVVQEMGRLTQTPTPALDTVLALIVQRAKMAGTISIDRPVEAPSPAFA
jgi:2-dehydropantoate 2-reductase